jgi:pyruvate/2-oxoglutarate dehydrogenase complex dihydrolipoamide dehydrogenase (E3) component
MMQSLLAPARPDRLLRLSWQARERKWRLSSANGSGIECDEVIHSILDVMYANAPYTVIQRAMHIHPTVSELIPTMLGELQPLE